MSRRFETAITIGAAPDAVWRALVEADTLTQWFATDATIEARPGGAYAISWYGEWPWNMTVLEAIPGRRLRLQDPKAVPFSSDGKPIDEAEPAALVLEFHLEPAGAGTTLRVVHSGFGEGQNWDDELDGVGDGWTTELRILQHYLTHHAGRRRHIVSARRATSKPIDEAWTRLTGPGGLFDEGMLEHARAGTAVSLRVAADIVVRGEVIFALPRRHALIRTDIPERGLLNVMVHRAAGAVGLQAVLSSWADAPDLAAFGREAQARLDRIASEVQASA